MITIVYNAPLPGKIYSKNDQILYQDNQKTIDNVSEALKDNGFKVDYFGVTKKNYLNILNVKTDLFFNLCFEIEGIDDGEAIMADLLEKTKIPFTGPRGRVIRNTSDKIKTKKILFQNRIPTPCYFLMRSERAKKRRDISFPLILKLPNESSSVGLSQDSVVENYQEMKRKIASLLKRYGPPIMAEEYIDGRELNITIIGNGRSKIALPISEIIFTKKFPGRWKIVDFEAKFDFNSPYYQSTIGVCPSHLAKNTERKIKEISLRAYEATDCCDYARIDTRLAPNGMVYILEINVNPGISINDGTVRSSLAAGLSYKQFIKKIVEAAFERFRKKRI